jgi:hypothetical protein
MMTKKSKRKSKSAEANEETAAALLKYPVLILPLASLATFLH